MKYPLRYYLGEEVKIIGAPVDGWVECEWKNGKHWRHWISQLKKTPWGE